LEVAAFFVPLPTTCHIISISILAIHIYVSISLNPGWKRGKVLFILIILASLAQNPAVAGLGKCFLSE
jgi:hypothetical protein